MTAAFTTRDQATIEARLWVAMDCQPLATGLRKEDKQRVRKRQRVTAASDKFFEIMNSDNPPQSREEVIRLTIGTLGMVLAYLFPQYALAIRVAGWLWDYLHG
jgi:hypothetical protein